MPGAIGAGSMGLCMWESSPLRQTVLFDSRAVTKPTCFRHPIDGLWTCLRHPIDELRTRFRHPTDGLWFTDVSTLQNYDVGRSLCDTYGFPRNVVTLCSPIVAVKSALVTVMADFAARSFELSVTWGVTPAGHDAPATNRGKFTELDPLLSTTMTIVLSAGLERHHLLARVGAGSR